MEGLARAYIEERIKKARTPGSDEVAARLSEGSALYPAEYSKIEAQGGYTASTASFLNQDTTVSIGHKAWILSVAYAVDAIRNADNAKCNQRGEYYAYYLRNAVKSIKISQALKRAAQRLRNT